MPYLPTINRNNNYIIYQNNNNYKINYIIFLPILQNIFLFKFEYIFLKNKYIYRKLINFLRMFLKKLFPKN